MIDRNEVLAGLAKAVLDARSHIGPRRPYDDDEPEDAKQWDDLTKAATELEALAAKAGRFLTITTDPDGVACLVSWQDDEHRILEVVWEAPAKAEPQGGEGGLVLEGRAMAIARTDRPEFEWEFLSEGKKNHYRQMAYNAFAAHPAPKPAEGEVPEAVREMLAEGWELDYSPDTGFIGFSHPQGGRQSLLEICKGRRDQGIGEFIVRALAAAPKRGRE